MSDFDLRQLVRDVLESSTDADPLLVWKEVLDLIPVEHYRSALDAMGPQYVRVAAHQSAQRPPRVPVTAKPNPSHCRRARRYVDVERVSLSSDERDWELLANCTAEMCEAAAKIRRDMAAANVAAATRYERLAEKVRLYRVDTVGDLPDEVILEALR